MEFVEKELECVDCHDSFLLTAGEQQFFHDKGFSTPKRCKSCRMKKKIARGED